MRSAPGVGSMAKVPGTLQKLAYDLARQALARQETMLEDLRTRTGTLLTATALVASFLGARALDGGAHRAFAVTGAGLVIGCIVVCVYILAPRSGIYAAISGSAARTRLIGADAAIDDAGGDGRLVARAGVTLSSMGWKKPKPTPPGVPPEVLLPEVGPRPGGSKK